MLKRLMVWNYLSNVVNLCRYTEEAGVSPVVVQAGGALVMMLCTLLTVVGWCRLSSF